MRAYPFPDRVASREELERDILYKRIPAEDRTDICEAAWYKGAAAAQAIFEKYGSDTPIREIIADSGLVIAMEYKDHVIAGIRYFSEYFSGRKKIIVYQTSIQKWATANELPYAEAEDLILAHEFYHHLECTKIGLTSRDYMIPNLKVGKWVISKSGIRALSEIGAHGFARTFFELRGELPESNQHEIELRNRAMNLMSFEGKRTVQKLDISVFGRMLVDEIKGKR